ncbi:hypothetical protein ABG840_05950 [Phocaeicola vulgatus]
MKKIILIAYALTCTASLYAGHSKELKLTSPEGVHEVMFRQEKISSSVNEIVLKSASNLNGNLNCSKELEHYAS